MITNNAISNALLSVLFLVSSTVFSQEEVVINGSFEQPFSDTSRPAYWQAGFSDAPPSYADFAGNLTYDSTYATEGARSLQMMAKDTFTYAMTQILHVPTFDLDGKQVRIEVDIRHNNLTQPPVAFLLAVNPEEPPDPTIGTGLAGKAVIQADPGQPNFTTYKDTFTATANAEYMVLALTTQGDTGTAWFDDVSVYMDGNQPDAPPASVASPLDEARHFNMSFTTQNPIDRSLQAREEAMDTSARYGDAINIFTHVRWSEITGEPLSYGHEKALALDTLADNRDLPTILTFDFTHGSPQNVGDLNPKPNGDPVGDLSNPNVQSALEQELLTLVDTIDPSYVVVGIEMNLFYDNNPGQWPSYVDLFKRIKDSIDQRDTSIHVNTYFTLRWMFDKDANMDTAKANVWRQLLPELESVGYSAYPGNRFYPHPDSLAPDYFTAARQVAPNRPLFLNEFGVHGGDSTMISEAKQAATLDTILRQLNGVPTEMVSWYSLYDQQHLGQPNWFKDAFSSIGIHYMDGTPKMAMRTWQSAYRDTLTTGGTEQQKRLQKQFSVYPNPVKNSSSYIRFELEEQQDVRLMLFDLQGRTIRTIEHSAFAKGQHTITIPAQKLFPGNYLINLKVGNQYGTKMLQVIE